MKLDMENSIVISPSEFDAILFDMDGVVTRTATIHFAAWKTIFDACLQEHEGAKFRPFTEQDYLAYVDGKPRKNGASSFLDSRQIKLPEGSTNDLPSLKTISAIGKKKEK
jgi:beta-phosphoglucomutase-like phosphatase (HAD superfamily)